ncbi:MAG: BrnT family toxin [Planctomycetota bacterium]
MKVTGIIWLRSVVEKLLWKHSVTTDEVEEVLSRSPRYRFIEPGDVEGEHLYAALGQTAVGRYLIVFFIYKATGEALIVSARDMTKNEKRSHAKK